MACDGQHRVEAVQLTVYVVVGVRIRVPKDVRWGKKAAWCIACRYAFAVKLKS